MKNFKKNNTVFAEEFIERCSGTLRIMVVRPLLSHLSHYVYRVLTRERD
jgi:hypothetical protein